MVKIIECDYNNNNNSNKEELSNNKTRDNIYKTIYIN